MKKKNNEKPRTIYDTKVLIVGLGDAGKMHYKAYRRLGINNVFGTDLDRRKENHMLSEGLKIGKIGEEYDFVDVCVPTPYHHKIVSELLPKYNVLLEKPMCLTLADAIDLVKLANSTNRKLGIVHNQLFYPVLSRKRLLGASTVIIHRTYDEAFASWVFKDGGGYLYEVGYHAIYTFLYIMTLAKLNPKILEVTKNGDEIEIMFDTGIVSLSRGLKEHDYIKICYDNGAKCTFLPQYNFHTAYNLPTKLRLKANFYWYALLHKRMPYSDTHMGVLEAFSRYTVFNDNTFKDYRFNPDLSVQVLRVLEEVQRSTS